MKEQRVGGTDKLSNREINPLQPNTSMKTLHTILYTIPTGLTRRTCYPAKAPSHLVADHFFKYFDLGVIIIVRRNNM